MLPTLRARALLVLTSVFILSHIASLVIYEENRHETVILTEATDLADRVIGIVDLAQRFPEADRAQILAAAQTQFLSMYPGMVFPTQQNCEQNEFSERIEARLGQWFSEVQNLSASICVRDMHVASAESASEYFPGFEALVAINFPDGEQAIFQARLPDAPSLFSDAAFAYILLPGLLALLIAWFLISRLLLPLGQLANAANEIGTNLDAPALPESGSTEVAKAAYAFNQMQDRLKRLVNGQTEMLAAISHDLRSTATRLQLRSELLEDAHEREGMLRVVSDMRAMIESVLDFVRGVEPHENARKTNLLALVESLCEDLREEGYPIKYELPDIAGNLICRPAALRRCFQNIIDNGVKYGGQVSVGCYVDADTLVVYFDDEGPGVPDEELFNLTQPFYRLESSRNRDSGGVGLGLAITQNITQGHGGSLLISNREEGGLRVEVRLPLGLA
ncbi:MAG: ATP-binding protein [Pseudohongiellaceae bacterium]|nr:ATP-binding protein [Pseudohongiellaceae bacterium]